MKALKVMFNTNDILKVNKLIEKLHNERNKYPFFVAFPDFVNKKEENNKFIKKVGDSVIIYADDFSKEVMRFIKSNAKDYYVIPFEEAVERAGDKYAAFTRDNNMQKTSKAYIKNFGKKIIEGKITKDRIKDRQSVQYFIATEIENGNTDFQDIYWKVRKKFKKERPPFIQVKSNSKVKKVMNGETEDVNLYAFIGIKRIDGTKKDFSKPDYTKTNGYGLSKNQDSVFLPLF